MSKALPAVSLLAEANIPTEHGPFRLAVFQVSGDPAEHLAMIKGSVAGSVNLPVRVHSECLTSEVMGSLKCDCRDQLDAGLAYIANAERGMVIYLRQEGRGIGLVNKIRAYALQEHGADTIAANQMLGLQVDSRRYDAAAALLSHLGVLSIQLLTNNPDKMDQLAALGVKITGRIPVVMEPNPHSIDYLRTKQARMQHQLDLDAEAPHGPARLFAVDGKR